MTLFNFSTLEKEFKYIKSETDKCSTILSDAEHLSEIFCYQRKGNRGNVQRQFCRFTF